MEPLKPEELAAVRAISTPTICNAIETFNIGSRNEGFMDATITPPLSRDRPRCRLRGHGEDAGRLNRPALNSPIRKCGRNSNVSRNPG